VSLTPTRVASIVLLGVLGTGVAYVLSYRVIADLGATKASLVTYIIPVVAVIVGILVLDEPFEARLLVGGALTIAGIAAVNSKPRARVPEPSVVGP
jgi:drug/metabolite transporter (DMT)-like permease